MADLLLGEELKDKQVDRGIDVVRGGVGHGSDDGCSCLLMSADVRRHAEASICQITVHQHGIMLSIFLLVHASPPCFRTLQVVVVTASKLLYFELLHMLWNLGVFHEHLDRTTWQHSAILPEGYRTVAQAARCARDVQEERAAGAGGQLAGGWGCHLCVCMREEWGAFRVSIASLWFNMHHFLPQQRGKVAQLMAERPQVQNTV